MGLVPGGEDAALIVSEETVAVRHGVRADVVVHGGEASKSLATVEALARALVDKGARRDTLLVAVGGGAVLDVRIEGSANDGRDAIARRRVHFS